MSDEAHNGSEPDRTGANGRTLPRPLPEREGGDRLAELLRQADADAGPPPVIPVDLAARVRRRDWQRRQRWLLAGSAAAAVLVGLGWWAPWARERPGAPTPAVIAAGPDVARLQAELAGLRREVAVHEAVARQLVELQAEAAEAAKGRLRLAALEAEAVGPDPVRQARKHADDAAAVLVGYGYRLETELGRPTAAAEQYGLVIRLFPDSGWATVARERLAGVAERTVD